MHGDQLVGTRSTVRGMVFLQIAANGLGVVVVGLYFWLLFPGGGEGVLGDAGVNLVVFGVYTAVMLVVALPINATLLRRAVSWVSENREPTEKERTLLFSLPTVETLSALVSWVVAAIIFGRLNEDARRVSVGIVLAGVVVCTMLYLLLEGHFRPLFALALSDADLPEARRDVWPRLMLAWVLGSGIPLLAIGLGNQITPLPLDGSRLAWVSFAAMAAGGIVMWLAARSVERPIVRIRDGLRRIERGDLDVVLPVDDLGELGRLTEGVNNLAAGLRERDALRDVFNRQVGQAGLADLAISGHAGEQREVTVLFVDLRGYTRFAERHTPSEVVGMLNHFFSSVVAVVNREGGWVNKFEGDAALCIFGAPQDQADHASRALRGAESIPKEMALSGTPLQAGVGVASGVVLAGFVGTAERFEYTVIGDVVNLASRLCEEAKRNVSGVLASATTVDMADMADRWQPAGRIALRGRRERALVSTPISLQERPSRWPAVMRFNR